MNTHQYVGIIQEITHAENALVALRRTTLSFVESLVLIWKKEFLADEPLVVVLAVAYSCNEHRQAFGTADTLPLSYRLVRSTAQRTEDECYTRGKDPRAKRGREHAYDRKRSS